MQVLKVDALNTVLRCRSRTSLFASVAGTGSGIGPWGGRERVGHLHLRTLTCGASLGRCGIEMPVTAPTEVDGN